MEISEIRSLAGPIATLLPVQSLRQGVSYVAFTLVGALLFETCLKLFSLPDAPPIVLVGAFSGSSVILNQTLPAEFDVGWDDPLDMIPTKLEILRKLGNFGYRRESSSSEEHITFKSRLPKILRWEENRMTVRTSSSGLMISGPILIIRILHARLVKSQPR